MKVLKVKNLTANEVKLRNHIYMELGGQCNYEDDYSNKKGVVYDFQYGLDMKSGVLETWAKSLKWEINFTKGVFGSLINKGVIYEVYSENCRYGQNYALIGANCAEADAHDKAQENRWFDYDLEGNEYVWELDK